MEVLRKSPPGTIITIGRLEAGVKVLCITHGDQLDMLEAMRELQPVEREISEMVERKD